MRGLLFWGFAVVALGGCAGRTAPPAPPPPIVEPPPVPPPPPPEPECIATHGGECLTAPEFEAAAGELAAGRREEPGFGNQWGLEAIGAHRAYAHVDLLAGPDAAPGEGVTIGVIDSGIDIEHPAFAGRTIHRGFIFGASEETGTLYSHGTAVASIAAGSRTGDPEAPHGVAWGADLAVWAIPLGTADSIYSPITLETLAAADTGIAEIFRQAFAWRDAGNRLDVLNLSFGYEGIIDDYPAEALRASLAETIATLGQADAAEKTILVWAAGNMNGDLCEAGVANCVNGEVSAVSVGVTPGLAAYAEELRGHSVVVAALGTDDAHGGAIADFSNRCGIAADYCIAAPGERVGLAYFGPTEEGDIVRGYSAGRGTSFAAPFVTGGLAIMKQLFRDQLSNGELVGRLFATADRAGIYADREIYGHGRMDLGAATSPVGVLEVPLAAAGAGRAQAPLGATGLRLGAAFGGGVAEAFGDGELMALDDFGAPFWYELSDFAATTDGPAMSARLQTFLGPGTGGLAAVGGGGGPGLTALGVTGSVLRMPTAAGNGHLALAEGAVAVSAAEGGGISATVFTTGPLRPLMPASGAAVAWRPGGFPVGLRAGWISEGETMLGSLGTGAFGTLSAGTAFVGVGGSVSLGGWRFGAGGEFGVANPGAAGGLIREISALATSTFAVHASRAFERAGSVSFSVSQPLRVERGWAALTAPSARTKGGEVLYRSVRADLAPGERQLDVAAQWNRGLLVGEFRVGAVWSRWPGTGTGWGRRLRCLRGGGGCFEGAVKA